MGGLTVEALCQRHRLVALDSNLFIYLMERVEPWDGLVAEVISAVENGACRATVSAVALGEVLVGPARVGELAQVERYAAMLDDTPGLSIQPVNADTVTDAAVIAGIRGMSLSDAIHLASARAAGATAFITNDHRIRGSAKLEVIYLDDIVAADG